MKIFEKDGKVNFVDENNVLVGFAYEGRCCEFFGYYFTDSRPKVYEEDSADQVKEPNLEGFYFSQDSPDFFDGDGNDAEGSAVFKLSDGDGKFLYLVLYNSHNGYYSHGFHMDVGGFRVFDGDL